MNPQKLPLIGQDGCNFYGAESSYYKVFLYYHGLQIYTMKILSTTYKKLVSQTHHNPKYFPRKSSTKANHA